MPWHELKLLKWKQIEEKPAEKPKMSTATTVNNNSSNNNNSSVTTTGGKPTKTAATLTKNKRRRNLLLGKLSDDLDYLEGLIFSHSNFYARSSPKKLDWTQLNSVITNNFFC